MLIFPQKLTVTGKDPVSLQTFNEQISWCENVRATQEGAGTIIIYHLGASRPTKKNHCC